MKKLPPEGRPISNPILYSFRRCPYAMRARLGIASAGIEVELREIVLRDKPAQMLEASPKGTVPVLITDKVIDESFDIMHWALAQADPEDLLTRMTEDAYALIEENDGPFKTALDLTKYAVRHPEADPKVSRATAAEFITKLDAQLNGKPWAFRAISLAWPTSRSCRSYASSPIPTSNGGTLSPLSMPKPG